MEFCDIYISPLKYENIEWADDPDSLLQLIYDNLSEITGFYFVSISLNMSQVYNVSLKTENYDSMVLYLKGIKYNKKEFLSLDDVQELEQEIRKQLGFIENLEIGDMHFKTSKLYSDKDLGIVEERNSIVSTGAPRIIEST